MNNLNEIDERNVSEALDAVADFHKLCPIFSGSELEANVLFERHAQENRPVTGEALAYTFSELQGEGLMHDTDTAFYAEMVEPVQDVREVEAPEVEQIQASAYDALESDEKIELELEVPADVSEQLTTFENLISSLNNRQLHDLITDHEAKSAPKQQLSVEEEIESLDTLQLGALISRMIK